MTSAETREIFEKVRQIEIRTNRLARDTFAGQYHSVFKGRGMDFDEVREYVPGDEIRSIDWNVTARTGRPFVKKYREERELTILLLVAQDAAPAHAATLRLTPGGGSGGGNPTQPGGGGGALLAGGGAPGGGQPVHPGGSSGVLLATGGGPSGGNPTQPGGGTTLPLPPCIVSMPLDQARPPLTPCGTCRP